MNPTPERLEAQGEDDPRLLRAAQEYLAELEAGRRPNRDDFVERFPEIAEELAPYLEALDLFHTPATQPPSSFGRPVPEDSFLGEPLGDFRIVREIGRGGMGVVYEAVQISLGRRVALKVLPFAAALDAKHLQRFKNEAQAAAQLHHTNIVPVYAVGCERGQHFYAMQLIEGQNLAAVIEDLRRREVTWGPGSVAPKQVEEPTASDPAPPRAGATPPPKTRTKLNVELSTQRSERSLGYFRTVARLIAQAAQALDYAHGLGIIHRDIKPANLLVDDRGNVWVTDFGLARLHDDTRLTHTGDLLGTLRYMSPEQAGGPNILLDHRTDVYSLGATLYEVLTLRPIFDGGDRQTLLRQILHEDPRLPRAIDRSIPPELETIVLKAIGKTPAERYATAQEFADDLQRFLEDRPIRARRPSLPEKARKWARRHRGMVISAVVALLLLVAGQSVATVFTVRAWDRERQQAQEAKESFRQAREAVDQFTRISEEELASIHIPEVERLRRRLLEVSLGYYQSFIDQRGDDPTLQAELITSRADVKRILNELTTLMGSFKYSLLLQDSVKDALQLDPGQRKILLEIQGMFLNFFPQGALPGSEDFERKRLALAQEKEKEVSKLLKPEQLQRFQQIALQVRGPEAFSDPDVVAALGLSTEQRNKIKKIQERALPPGPGFGPPGGRRRPPGDWDEDWLKKQKEIWGKWAEEQRQILAKILEVLTPEQTQKWKNLVGEDFKSEFRFGPPGFGPPHPPGGKGPGWGKREPPW